MKRHAEREFNPTYEDLFELLKNYGHADLRVPLHSMRFGNKTPWEVGVDIIFDDHGHIDQYGVDKWRKQIVDRVDVMFTELRRIGWIAHGHFDLHYTSRIEPPVCTLRNYVVRSGHEYDISANASFTLIPVNGEVIDGSSEET